VMYRQRALHARSADHQLTCRRRRTLQTKRLYTRSFFHCYAAWM